MKRFFFTIDCDFVPNSNQVFDSLLQFIEFNNLKPTFFLTGKFAEIYPDLCFILAKNYEIGCHGLYHGLRTEENFSKKTSPIVQYKTLKKATNIIESVTKVKPTIFRAPYLQVSTHTFDILQDLGYSVDSSIPARRFDFFCGSINNLQYIKSPVEPYYIKDGLLEIPPSANLLPYNLRFIKLFGVKSFLYSFKLFLCNRNNFVFFMHPGELVNDRNTLNYPAEKDFFYKGGGLHLLHSMQTMLNVIRSNGFESCYMGNLTEQDVPKL